MTTDASALHADATRRSRYSRAGWWLGGNFGCLWLFVCGVSVPWRGTAEGAGDTPLQGHDSRDRVPGPPGPPQPPRWRPAPRGGAARAAAPPAGQGGDPPCPRSLPGPSVPASPRFPRSAPPGSVCLQRGRSCRHRYGVGGPGERGNTCFQHGEGGEGARGGAGQRRSLSLPSRRL